MRSSGVPAPSDAIVGGDRESKTADVHAVSSRLPHSSVAHHPLSRILARVPARRASVGVRYRGAQPVHLRDYDATVADSFRATLATKVGRSPWDAFNIPCIVPIQMCRFLRACGAWSEDCGGNDACAVSGARRTVSGSISKAERATLEDSRASVVPARRSGQVRQASFTDLLDAQRLYHQARLGIARAQSNRFRDIALPFVALSGDAPH